MALFLTRRRLRIVLFRIVAPSLGAGFLLYLVPSILLCVTPSSVSHDRRNIKRSVDTILEQALSDHLVRQNLVGVSVTGRHAALEIGAIQNAINCEIEQDSETWASFKQFPRGIKPSELPPKSSCSISVRSNRKTNSPVADLCSLIRGSKILLVGPETTFHLHSSWLNALEAQENRTHTCLGPEFCTFHHICQAPLNSTQVFASEERFKKHPRNRDLVESGSSILRYVLSSTLYASDDLRDPAYTRPIIDPQTGVRVRNAYWLASARRVDIVVMNRGPLPAPAWSYGGQSSEGDWAFVDQLSRNDSTSYIRSRETLAARIINAALHASLTSFLPSVHHSLSVCQLDPLIRQKILVWHGSWYLQHPCSCIDTTKRIRVMEDPLQPHLHAPCGIDPWALYYNSQVYMQNYLLAKLLPHYGVVFLAQAISPAPASGNFIEQLATSEGHRNACLLPDFGTEVGKARAAVFLAGLVKLLEQTGWHRSVRV